MATGFGHNAWIGIATETTYGTAVAAAKFLEILEENLAYKRSVMSRPSLRRTSQEHYVKGKKSVEGGFKIQFPFDGSELLLKHGFGTVATTGASAPWQHVFTGATALPTGLSVTVNRDADNIGGSSCFQYEGCQISKLSFSQAKEDFLILSADLIGEDAALIAKPSPTFPTFIGCDWEMLTTATIGGTAFDVEDFEINIDNMLASDRYKLGTALRKGLGRTGPRKVDGKFTLEFASLTQYNYYKNLTNQAVVIEYTGPSLGGSNYLLRFDIPKVFFSGDDPAVKEAGPIKLQLNFEAFMNAAEGDELSVTLKNNVSSVTG